MSTGARRTIHRAVAAAGATAALGAGLLVSAPAAQAAADGCAVSPGKGLVCIDARTDQHKPYSAGDSITATYELYPRGNPSMVSVSGMSVVFGFSCSANGDVKRTVPAAFEAQSFSGRPIEARATVQVPDICGGGKVFLRQAGPVGGTVLSDDEHLLSMWVSFTGKGESSTSIGGQCVDPGPISGVSQLPGLGGYSTAATVALFAVAAGAVGLRRRRANAPVQVAGRTDQRSN